MFEMEELKKCLESLPANIQKDLIAYGNTSAASLQGEAQKTRPWKDHTADARKRIKGYCTPVDTGIRIYLAHGVEYGVYLEFANEKKYAVIYPVLRRKGPEILNGAVKVVNKSK